MNQERLNQLNTEVTEAMQQYVSGLMTIVEFSEFMLNIRIRIGDDKDFAGLIDPNTGLSWPTKEDTEAFNAECDRLAEGMPVVELVHTVVVRSPKTSVTFNKE